MSLQQISKKSAALLVLVLMLIASSTAPSFAQDGVSNKVFIPVATQPEDVHTIESAGILTDSSQHETLDHATPREVSKSTLPDLTISYYYDKECNLYIVITNVGNASTTIGGKNNPNVVGINGSSVIGMGNSPTVLNPGQQHEIFIPAHVAAGFNVLTVDPNNNIVESNEGNSINVEPCKGKPSCAAKVKIFEAIQTSPNIRVGFAWETLGASSVTAKVELFAADGTLVNSQNVGSLTPVASGTQYFLLAGLNIPSGTYKVRVTIQTDCGASSQSETFVTYTAPNTTVCHAAVDPYLGNYDNGTLKATICLTVAVNGSMANLTGFGRNQGIGGIVAAPLDTTTTLACRIRQNGNYVTGNLGWDFATWDFQIELNATVQHQSGDTYELSCEHEWDVPSESFYLMSTPQPVTIP